MQRLIDCNQEVFDFDFFIGFDWLLLTLPGASSLLSLVELCHRRSSISTQIIEARPHRLKLLFMSASGHNSCLLQASYTMSALDPDSLPTKVLQVWIQINILSDMNPILHPTTHTWAEVDPYPPHQFNMGSFSSTTTRSTKQTTDLLRVW